MRTLLIILLIAAAAAGYWYFASERQKERVRQSRDEIAAQAERLKESAREKLKDIRTDDIKEELARTGKVVRQKARQVGAAVADATADARITAAIKAKLIADPDLSALKISVNTTDGVVTLAGTLSSH